MRQGELARMPVEQMSLEIRGAWEQLNKLTGNAEFVEVFANAPTLLDFVMDKFYAKIFF